jgi:hypothetical protein
MPWTEPAYVATGDVMTASQWNSQVVDNLKHIADKVGRGSGVHVGTSVDPGAGHLLVAGIVSWLGQSMAVWSSAGTYSWTVPAGVYRVRAIVTGGGGGGGAGAGSWENIGGGGGAGATAFATFNVTPGETLTIVVGAGGAGGSGRAGGDGQPSQILRGATVLVEAAGGSGGPYNPGGGTAGGGAGGNSAVFGEGVVGFFVPGGIGFGGSTSTPGVYTEGYGGISFWGMGSPNVNSGITWGAPGAGGGGGTGSLRGRPGQPGIVVIFY